MIVVKSHNIISPLGWTSQENFANVLDGNSGIKLQSDTELSENPFQAALIDDEELKAKLDKQGGLLNYSKLEQLAILSMQETVLSVDPRNTRTGIILSTTKGNVGFLSNDEFSEEVYLGKTAQNIADYFGFKNTPHIISNACISGLAAFIVAKRFIDAGMYDDVVIVGVDILSKFIVSGFQSFQSLSPEPCKPFDKNRDGLSLGEGAASAVVSRTDSESSGFVEVVNGSIANDANHISGPSRTGEGLYRAIKQTLKGETAVDAVFAHGTATPYNDDMESHAISRSGFSDIPVSGLKGYFGHTLGAAGVIESIISIMALQQNTIIATKGIQEQGVAENITVAKETAQMPLTALLKLMSGFGGCNAAVYFKKHE